MLRFIGVCTAALILAGCAAPVRHQNTFNPPATNEPVIDEDQVRRQAYVDANPALDPRIRECILQSKVCVGMTEADVRASAGAPTRVNRSTSTYTGQTVQMVYGDAPRRGHYIYLTNGKVTSMESVGEN